MNLRTSLALVLWCAPIAAYAQRVSGTVRATGSPLPLTGVVVATIDSAGRSLARTLSDHNGRYSLPAPSAAARVRAIRIGYRPATAEIAHSGGDVSIDLVMDPAPVVLQTVRVSSDASCGTTADGKLVLQVWEQARSALLAAIVARDANPARVEMIAYQRRMEPARRRIVEQRLATTSGLSRRPVAAARSGAELAADGYRRREGTDHIYFAPDADVLFDDAFGEAHCFGLIPGRGEHSGRIGLTFAPRKNGRRDFVDVEGVLWIDPRTPELIQLDYRYTGLDPELQQAGAGGAVHFRTMSNGVVFIDSWSILTPLLSELVRRDVMGSAVARGVVGGFMESGGFVVSATWADGTEWSDPLGGIRGQVREEKTRMAVQGVEMATAGAAARTDSAGAFALLPVPPGRYEVTLLDSAFSQFVRPRRQSRDVVVGRRDTATADFAVTPRETVLADVCRGQPRAGSTIVLLGRIGDGSDKLPEELRIEASWYESPAGSASLNMQSLQRSVQLVDVNSTGGFSICGIARTSSRITIRAMLGKATVADTSIQSTSREAPTAVSTRAFEWSLPAGFFESLTRRDGAVLSGRVTRNGAPVPGAQVWMVFGDTTVTTDSTGRFRVAGLRAGPHMVQVRRIGYAVKRDTVLLRPREETVRDFTMDGLAELDTVRTIGATRKYDTPRLQEFERRRLSGQGGTFISEDDLREYDAAAFSSVIRAHIPGARIEVIGAQAYLLSRTTGNLSDLPKGCYATVFVDGHLLYDGPAGDGKDEPIDIGSFMTAGLSGVEYYRGGASLPLQFRSRRNDCGTLILWTRGK